MEVDVLERLGFDFFKGCSFRRKKASKGVFCLEAKVLGKGKKRSK